MKIYLVGGAVRDKLLGLPVTERDWVVVNGTPEEMVKLGYRQVGKEFPVFLHPKTNEEYALARMERKVGPGYKGFTFDTSPAVTLEEDLLRRDLTINAMAELDNQLVDPYHGKEDLEKRILRHVSPAFAEDPVRILRVARFLARYHYLGFNIAPETIELMRKMVTAGEVNALVAERVWKELERALGEKNPEKFFETLDVCGALTVLFAAININNDGMKALTFAGKQNNTSPLICFAALTHTLSKKTIDELCDRYRMPNDYRKLARLTAQFHQLALRAKSASAEELLELFSVFDLYRHTSRFNDFLTICQAIADTHQSPFDDNWLKCAAEKTASTDIKDILKKNLSGEEVGLAIKKQRLESLSEWLSSHRENGGSHCPKM